MVLTAIKKRLRSRRFWAITVLAALIALLLTVLLPASRTVAPEPTTGTAQVASPLCAAGSIPQVFTGAAQKFTATFPCSPIRNTSTANTPFGQINIVTYEAERDGINYAVAYVDYGALIPGDLPGLARPIVLDGAKRAALRSAKADSNTAKYADVTLGKHSGQSISASSETHQLLARVFLVEKQTYQVAVLVPKAKLSAAQVALTAFLDSFKLIE